MLSLLWICNHEESVSVVVITHISRFGNESSTRRLERPPPVSEITTEVHAFAFLLLEFSFILRKNIPLLSCSLAFFNPQHNYSYAFPPHEASFILSTGILFLSPGMFFHPQHKYFYVFAAPWIFFPPQQKYSCNFLPLKGTQDWEFFWLRFWMLYYFIVSYVQILRFCQKMSLRLS